MFERLVPVRWRDTDAQGHVNHAVFLTYLEEARDAFYAQVIGAAGVDAALLGRKQSGYRLQQGRLARAVPADDPDRVAVVDHERDAPDRVHLADGRPALALHHPH